MAIKVGDKLPNIEVSTMTPDGPKSMLIEQLFMNKKVAFFGVPGAFTPTCSARHLPGFVKHAQEIKNKGIELIACISVNDVFVMGAWGVDQKVGDDVILLADGSAFFAKAAGLSIDSSERGMGIRCKRFLMIVENLIVTHLKTDLPGQFDNTSAEMLLGNL